MKNSLSPRNYLRYLPLSQLFTTKRTREILSVNPTVPSERIDATHSEISVFNYDASLLVEDKHQYTKELLQYKEKPGIVWINIDGIKKADIEEVCQQFSIHALLLEDILSVGQRPKTDEVEGVLYCLLNMLYFNNEKKQLKQSR